MTVDDFAPLPGPGIVVGDELLGADPDMVRGFASAVVAAQEQIAADPQRGRRGGDCGGASHCRRSRDGAWRCCEATIEAWDPPVTGQIAQDVWQMGYETMQRLGFIDGSVPVQDMYDVSVME